MLLQMKDTFPSVEALHDGNLVLRLLVLRQLVSSKGRSVQTFFQYFPCHAKDLLALLIPKFEFPKPQNPDDKSHKSQLKPSWLPWMREREKLMSSPLSSLILSE